MCSPESFWSWCLRFIVDYLWYSGLFVVLTALSMLPSPVGDVVLPLASVVHMVKRQSPIRLLLIGCTFIVLPSVLGDYSGEFIRSGARAAVTKHVHINFS